MFSMQCRKNVTVEENKKRMNVNDFINIDTNIYTYIICDKNDSKWKVATTYLAIRTRNN